MIPLEKWKILTPLQKLPKYVGNLSKIIVATGFEKLPKVQYIAQSGHTGYATLIFLNLASFSFIFGLFQKNINTILQQINVKKCPSSFGTGVRTHKFKNVSLLP